MEVNHQSRLESGGADSSAHLEEQPMVHELVVSSEIISASRVRPALRARLLGLCVIA
jgi:hypothetical protein